MKIEKRLLAILRLGLGIILSIVLDLLYLVTGSVETLIRGKRKVTARVINKIIDGINNSRILGDIFDDRPFGDE